MILGGDLGGTKTLLALAERDGDGVRIVRRQRYASHDYASFDDLLGEVGNARHRHTPGTQLGARCKGVAQ